MPMKLFTTFVHERDRCLPVWLVTASGQSREFAAVGRETEVDQHARCHRLACARRDAVELLAVAVAG